MPTVLKLGGLRAVIYPNDHRPAHVHVLGKGCEAVFELRCPDGPPEMRENYGFSYPDVTRIERQLVKALAKLCDEWRGIHGQP